MASQLANSVATLSATLRHVTDEKGLQEALLALQEATHVAYDVETTGLDPLLDKVLLLQFYAGQEVYVVSPRDVDPRPLLNLLAGKVVLAHNAVIEYTFTKTNFGIELSRWYDSMLVENILTAGLPNAQAGLDHVVKKYLKANLDKQLQTSFVGQDPETFQPTEEQLEYSAVDVLVLPAIREAQIPKLRKHRLVNVAAMEFALLPVVGDMQLAGMRLDVECHSQVLQGYVEREVESREEAVGTLTFYYHKWAHRENARRAVEVEKLQAGIDRLLPSGRLTKDAPESLREAVGLLRKEKGKLAPKPLELINLGSSEQVWRALAEAGIELRDSGGKSTMKRQVVEKNMHRHPVLSVYAEWAKVNKVVTTYGLTLQEKVHPLTGRVHGQYKQVVSTGRTSSKKPNMQNMPPDIRNCFVPAEGNVFVVADFSNMEGRIAAGLTGDPVMLDIFRNNKDWHSMTAAAAWPERFKDWTEVPKDGKERKAGKTANFAGLFGGSGRGLYWRGLVDSLEIGDRLQQAQRETYVVMFDVMINQWGEGALRWGNAKTAMGRKRFFYPLPPKPSREKPEELQEWKKQRAGIIRAAMNHPIQGTGADIAKRSMLLMRPKLLDLGARIIGFVHDEVIVESPQGVAQDVQRLIGEAMAEAGREMVPQIPIPAEVSIAERWVK